MHQVVTAQLAARRAGTQSTETRAEVAGGGAKPWRQKGTGRARQGSIRSPQWRGGGVALGPKPRSYAQRTPKKMVRLALRSALSDRAADGKVVVVDEWTFDDTQDQGRRRRARRRSALDGQGAAGARRGRRRHAGAASATSPTVHCLYAGELNAYDVLSPTGSCSPRATLPAWPRSRRRAADAGRAPVKVECQRRRANRRRDDGETEDERRKMHWIPATSSSSRSCARSRTRCSSGTSTRSASTPTRRSPRSTTPSRRSSTSGAEGEHAEPQGQAQAQPPHLDLRQAPRHEAGHRHPRRGRPHRAVRGD